MNDNIKENWQNIGDFSGAMDFTKIDPDQFRKSRSGTVYGKVRSTVLTDLVIKSIFIVVIGLDMVFYHDSLPVIIILGFISVLLVLTFFIEVVMLRRFAAASDPGQSSRENLASMLTFLERESLLPVISMAATQIIIFIPGLLLYFQIFYGYLKPITPLSFFAFGTLCLISVVTSLTVNLSQIRYHKKHIQVCLSDLNENTLAIVARNVEESRKRDATIKFLLGIVITFGFVAMLVILKAVLT